MCGMKRLSRGKVAAAIALASIALAGCTGEGAGSAEATVSAAPAASASHTPESAEATTAQWASRVAESQAGIRDAYASWNDSECLPTNVTPICAASLVTMALSAEVLALGMEGGLKEDVPASLGVPPDEIAALVDQTIADARAATDSSKTAGDACLAGECVSEAFGAVTDYDSLTSTLDAWAPYGA
jgi:hypothetical protein